MNNIEKYDDDIFKLKSFCSKGGWFPYIEQETLELLKELAMREVEKLTAERNNLIRLGGIR